MNPNTCSRCNGADPNCNVCHEPAPSKMPRERILEIVVDHLRDITQIDEIPEHFTRSDLGLDSLDILELAEDLEDELDIEIPEKWDTISELVNLLDSRLNPS